MFFIRSAFWLALLVAILPSDPKEQARMYQTASYALHRASTFCDRNKAVCDEASVYWDAFKVKLFVGATMVRALVNERLEARQHDTPLLERGAVPPIDTLSRADRRPAWELPRRTGS